MNNIFLDIIFHDCKVTCFLWCNICVFCSLSLSPSIAILRSYLKRKSAGVQWWRSPSSRQPFLVKLATNTTCEWAPLTGFFFNSTSTAGGHTKPIWSLPLLLFFNISTPEAVLQMSVHSSNISRSESSDTRGQIWSDPPTPLFNLSGQLTTLKLWDLPNLESLEPC